MYGFCKSTFVVLRSSTYMLNIFDNLALSISKKLFYLLAFWSFWSDFCGVTNFKTPFALVTLFIPSSQVVFSLDDGNFLFVPFSVIRMSSLRIPLLSLVVVIVPLLMTLTMLPMLLFVWNDVAELTRLNELIEPERLREDSRLLLSAWNELELSEVTEFAECRFLENIARTENIASRPAMIRIVQEINPPKATVLAISMGLKSCCCNSRMNASVGSAVCYYNINHTKNK